MLNAAAQYPHLCKAVVLLNAAGRSPRITIPTPPRPRSSPIALRNLRRLFSLRGNYFFLAAQRAAFFCRTILFAIYFPHIQFNEEEGRGSGPLPDHINPTPPQRSIIPLYFLGPDFPPPEFSPPPSMDYGGVCANYAIQNTIYNITYSRKFSHNF